MQTKKQKLFYIFIFLTMQLCFTNSIFAQTKKFEQILEWSEDENAFEYKVEIQNTTTGKSSYYETTENKITLSIDSGNYRYRVYAYDFLGRESGVSDWRGFNVIKARKPKVESLEGNVVVSAENKKQFSIPVDVTSITSESKVVLINEKNNKEIVGTLEIQKVNGEEVASNAVFPEVPEGSWKMKVKNPSGLFTETEKIEITKTIEKAAEKVEENPVELRLTKADQHEIEKRNAAKKQQEENAILEQQKKEEEIALQKKLEEERLAAEERRIAEEKRLAEEKRIAEEKRLAEEKRIAEEKRLAEENRKKEEKSIAERLEEEQKAVAKYKKEHPEEEKVVKEKRKYNFKDIQLMAGLGAIYNLYDHQLFGLEDFPVVPYWKVDFSYLPINLKNGQIGFDSEMVVYGIKSENEYLNINISGKSIRFDLLYHIKLNSKVLYLGLKAGPQLLLLETDVSRNQTYTSEVSKFDSLTYGYLGANGGVSLFVKPAEFLVMEWGANFTHDFIKNAPTGNLEVYFTVGGRL